ncbi:presenilin-like protein At2g29900 isoform X2 [Papaver somniferum]|uniref:presenilin-like protein At2g29900 isoform X2 n=1 Tax=Papaver somniferum TaxID=3469 RepID=UPI000E6F7CCD|nr:presenilin-like protein At2g29900 isoform X2 [Papaver somniferum]
MDENRKRSSILETVGEEMVRIITPVSICMFLVVLLVSILNNDSSSSQASISSIATIAYNEDTSDSDWAKFKVFMSNMAILITQGYLVVIGMFVAYWFTMLPEWTTWALLIALAFYDLAAVLLPGGPLRLLLELAISRDEDIPALVYEARPVINHHESAARQGVPRRLWKETGNSSTVGGSGEVGSTSDENSNAVVNMGSPPNPGSETLSSDTVNRMETRLVISEEAMVSERANELVAPLIDRQLQRTGQGEDVATESTPFEGIGLGSSGAIKLGLGDFIFYSVLVGRAAMYDFMTVYACYLAIIAGLGVTLMLLALYRKALPALPVSILLGVLFYVLTRFFLEAFVVECSVNLLMF